MNAYTGILGALLTAGACLLFGRGYSSYIRGRVEEYEAFLDFLEYIRRDMACFLGTPDDWGTSYSDQRLEKTGFLPRLREGVSLFSAFSEVSDSLSLAAEDKRTLGEYFERFGADSLEFELRAIDKCITDFSKSVQAERENSGQRIKLSLTLLMLLSAAIVILLI